MLVANHIAGLLSAITTVAVFYGLLFFVGYIISLF
jgi:hypothetical protein